MPAVNLFRNPHHTGWIRLVLLGCAVVLMSGCSWLLPVVEDDMEGRRLVALWTDHNRDLPPFKGLMRIRFEERGQAGSGRAAWAAVLPDRLRLELLNPLGQPLFSMAADGDAITLFSADDQRFYHLRQSSNALERFIQIPIGIEALVAVLAGQPYLPAYTTVRLAAPEGCRVVLENRWRMRSAELQSEDCRQLQSMSVYDDQGEFSYRVSWLEWQSYGGYTMPRKIRVINAAGEGLSMTLERLWFDPGLPADTFRIMPPD